MKLSPKVEAPAEFSSSARSFDEIDSRPRPRPSITALIILGTALVVALLVHNKPGWGDEDWGHLPQIMAFVEGSWEIKPWLPYFPGYHLVIAGLAKIFDVDSLPGVRTLTLLVSLPSVWVFYLCAKTLDYRTSTLRTLQYFFLPIIFPFFFLVYTDAFALLLVLLSLYAFLSERFALSGVTAATSLLVRQTNIIWLAMLFVMIYLEENGLSFSLRSLKQHCRRHWIFSVSLIAFLVFIVWNGGAVLNTASMSAFHPSTALKTGNLFFSLVVFFMIFLPSILHNLRRGIRAVRSEPGSIVLLLIVCLIYWLTFAADHPAQRSDWFLRNRFLHFVEATQARRALLLLPIGLSLISLRVTRLRRPSLYVLYGAWPLSLLPIWLIEQRYYMPIFAMFLLFRVRETPAVEIGTTVYFIALTGLFMTGMLRHLFFL